jgi:Right handed beta helix region
MHRTLIICALATAAVFASAAWAQTLVANGQTYALDSVTTVPAQNGAYLIKGIVSDIRIGPVAVTQAYRAIESADNSIANNLTIDGFIASDIQRDGIRLRQANNTNIRNFSITMQSTPQTGTHLPQGIALYAGNGIAIRDGRVSGFRMASVPGAYPNGDGIAAEREVTNLTIERVVSSNNSDAGFDLKSSGTVLDNAVADDNHRGFRFWGSARAGTLTSNNSRSAAFWFGKGADVTIDHVNVSSRTTAPVFMIEGANSVVVKSCTLYVPAGTKLIIGAASATRVTLGSGCTV